MSEPIKFSREPYIVKYHDLSGVVRTIKRRPPEKIHDILPKDKVELTRKKNDDWQAGEIYTAKNINPKHPNIIQIQGENESTFVSAYDLKLQEKDWENMAIGPNGERLDPRDEPINNKYLNWP